MRKKDYATFTSTGEILKADDENHFVLSPVLVPYKEDKQGDSIPPEEIEKTAHNFMEDYQVVGEMHGRIVGKKDVSLVESYILRDDQIINGRTIPSGTWMIGLKVYEPRIWEAIKKGEYKGVSIGGYCHACESKTKTKHDKKREKDGQILRDLEVEEISIVDEPAVPDAKWIIIKRQGGVELSEKKVEKQDLQEKIKEVVDKIKESMDKAAKAVKDKPEQAMEDLKAEMAEVIAELETIGEGYGYAYPAPQEKKDEEKTQPKKEEKEGDHSMEELAKAVKALVETKQEDTTPEIKKEVEKAIKEMVPELKAEIVKEVRKNLKPKVEKKEIPKEEEKEQREPKTLDEVIEMVMARRRG